jgi:hypothetical protein
VGLALGAGLLLLFAGCTETATPTQPTTRQATVSLQADSLSTPNLAAIRIAIASITLVAASGGTDATLSATSQTVDLVQLQLAASELLRSSTPPGDYTALQIEFDQANSEVQETAGGSTSPLAITATTITVPISVSLSANQLTMLHLTFNVGTSLHQDASGNWVYTPVLDLNAS